MKKEVCRLNVCVNFQTRILESSSSGFLTATTGLKVNDKVEIYPHTVNAHVLNSDPLVVAVRKINNDKANGPFIMFPVKNLQLSEHQKNYLTQIYAKGSGSCFNNTTISESRCSEILERATGMQMGDIVKFYPYTIDVFVEEDNGFFSVQPLITIAVRETKNNQAYGQFCLVSITDLNLNAKQRELIMDVITIGIDDFTQKMRLSKLETRMINKKFRKEISFVTEENIFIKNEVEM